MTKRSFIDIMKSTGKEIVVTWNNQKNVFQFLKEE